MDPVNGQDLFLITSFLSSDSEELNLPIISLSSFILKAKFEISQIIQRISLGH